MILLVLVVLAGDYSPRYYCYLC